MSLLQTYRGGMSKDIISLESQSYREGECTLAINMPPGEWVKHRWFHLQPGYGILVAVGKEPNRLLVDEDFVTVLWSVEPRIDPMTPSMGFVYAPYVPLQVTKLTLPPEDFAPQKGLRYYAKKVKSSFYGTIAVSDLK
jgi:hypothetical protein